MSVLCVCVCVYECVTCAHVYVAYAYVTCAYVYVAYAYQSVYVQVVDVCVVCVCMFVCVYASVSDTTLHARMFTLHTRMYTLHTRMYTCICICERYQCRRAVCVIKKQNKKIKINHTSAAAQEVANDGRAVIEDGFRV